MIDDKTIERINFLAKKSKSAEGLTDEEKVEQAVLRKEYIAAFRASTQAAIDSIRIKNPDGSIVPLKKKKQ